jgi:hypothetical protein
MSQRGFAGNAARGRESAQNIPLRAFHRDFWRLSGLQQVVTAASVGIWFGQGV